MTWRITDEAAMQLAIDASREALEAGDMPFGATLVSAAGERLWVARNRQVTGADCTAHAELVLVREAAAQLGPASMQGATVFASGEPCAMCAGAMFWAGIARVVYGASQPEIGAVLGGATLPIRTAETLQGAVPAVRVEGPLLGDAAVAVLRAKAG